MEQLNNMGSKSVRGRAFNQKQRKRMREMKLEDSLNKKGEYAEITTSQIICKNCGFKTRYQFFRCPQCNAEQK